MFVSGVKPDILTTDSIKDADFDDSAFFATAMNENWMMWLANTSNLGWKLCLYRHDAQAQTFAN